MRIRTVVGRKWGNSLSMQPNTETEIGLSKHTNKEKRAFSDNSSETLISRFHYSVKLISLTNCPHMCTRFYDNSSGKYMCLMGYI